MDLREITDDEIQDAYLLSAQAFNRGARNDNFGESRRNDPNRRPTTMFGLWDEGGLQAKVAITHYRQHFGPDCIFPMGGIGGVVSLPASRGRGYAGKLLRHALEAMRDRGEFVSDLFPFSWDFYDRLGWAWVGRRNSYVVPTRVLQSSAETESVRAAAASDGQAIAACYRTWASRYRGLVERDERSWDKILEHGESEYTYTFLYEAAGSVEGYLTFRGWKEEETSLREFAAITPRAMQALLGLLRRHEMQVKAFAWEAPEDDCLWQQRYHWDIQTKSEPVTMARVVDVGAALAAWKPPRDASGCFTIAVTDDVAAWNTGVWRVEFSGGVAAVRSGGDPGVHLDIRAFSQAYHGTPNTDSLRSAGRVTVHDESAFRAFQRYLEGPLMWMNDSF